MARSLMAPTTYAYALHLLFVAATGTSPELLTAILPCAWFYAEVGRHLVGSTPAAADHPYADWLATYVSPDFDAVGRWIRERLDARGGFLTAPEEAQLHEIFLTTPRNEGLFLQLGRQLSEWH